MSAKLKKQWPQDWEKSIFIPILNLVLKNVQTTGQLYSSPMLVKLCSKSFNLGFSITRTEKFQMFKLGLEKAEEPEIKSPTFTG